MDPEASVNTLPFDDPHRTQFRARMPQNSNPMTSAGPSEADCAL